mgnify:FL=1
MRYFTRRIGQAVFTFFAALTLSFLLYRMMPGGPIQAMVAERYGSCLQNAGPAACNIEDIREQVRLMVNIDPNKPIPQAYVDYLARVIFDQDFGTSTAQQAPVFEILFKAMPWSVFISIHGLVLGWIFNIFWGSAMAYNEGSRFDKVATIISMVGNSIPYYVAAILALAFLGFELALFPEGGRYPDSILITAPVIGPLVSTPNVSPGFNIPFMFGVTWSAALPIFTGFVLGINGLGMRGNAIRVIESDYNRVARLRGLSQMRIATRYVGRNAVLPIYTGFMIGIASIFGSGIVMERIFSYQAVGWYTFRALVLRDYPLLMGSFMFYTAITIIGILIADFTYGMIDPRASKGGGSGEY